MKFVHLSDLHLGKRLYSYSLAEDQKYILDSILRIIDSEAPDAVFISGDIYDRSVPAEEAVTLFDSFLFSLSSSGRRVFAISGNHDSAERLAFGARLMELSGVHMSPAYSGEIKPYTLEDGYGKVNIFLLPFIKPVHVKRFFPDEEITNHTSAVKTAVKHMDIDSAGRNILLCHQFVTGASASGSEELSVGGLENVDASVFDVFDYVALGHIHGAQNVGSERIRFCGTPLKYSFSEADHEKSVTVGVIAEKGSIEIRTVPLVPLRDMKKLRGSFREICALAAEMTDRENDAYMQVTLTDNEDIYDGYAKLSMLFPNLMELRYDNKRTRTSADAVMSGASSNKTNDPVKLFGEFFSDRNGYPLSDEQQAYISDICESIWEKE